MRENIAFEKAGRTARIVSDGDFSYSYNGGVSLRDKANRTASYRYDAKNGIFAISDFTGQKSTVYYFMRYDVAYLGKVRKIVDGKGNDLVGYRYDAKTGNVTRIRDRFGNDRNFAYDAEGRLAKATRRAAGSRTVEPVASFAYAKGREPVAVTLLNADGTAALTTRLSRDRQGNVVSVDDGRGKAEVSYNKSGFPVSVKDPLGNVSKICYNTFNAPVSVTDANGIVTKYAYNDAGLVARMERLDGSETLTTLVMSYDAAGRMVREGSKRYTYGYLDKVLSFTDGDATRTFTYHADGQLASATVGGDLRAPRDRVGPPGGRPLPETESFLWDGLALIQRGDEQFVNEPHVGNAPQKLCFGGEPRAERRARRARKGPRGNPVASSKGTSYFNDALGTTVGSKSNGKYSAAALTAFGEDLSVTSSGESFRSPFPVPHSPFFTGKPYVEGLGHAFLMRNYRAGLAKWQTADPLGYPDGWNALAYCGNGVASRVDVFGARWVYNSMFFSEEYKDEFVIIPDGMPIDALSVPTSLWNAIICWLADVATEQLVDYAKEIAWPLWERFKQYGSQEGTVIEDPSAEMAMKEMSDKGYDDWEYVSHEFSSASSDAKKINGLIQITEFTVIWKVNMRKWVE